MVSLTQYICLPITGLRRQMEIQTIFILVCFPLWIRDEMISALIIIIQQ